MATQEEIRIIIKAAAEQAIGQLNKLNQTLVKQEKSHRTLGDVVKNMRASYLAVAAAVSGVIATFKYCIDAAAEAEEAQAQLNAVLESTRGVAGMSAEGLNELADALSQTSIYEDDVIVKSESLLLTFTRIGKDVFPDAMQAILDVSTAMGQDLQSSTMQLGKALQDPILGMSTLRRVGIQLSESQQQQVRDFMAVNDVASAQKVILGELNTQFGGQALARAHTFSGAMERMKNALNNLGESIGNIAIPGLKSLINVLADATNAAAKFISKNWGLTEKENLEGQIRVAESYMKTAAKDSELYKAGVEMKAKAERELGLVKKEEIANERRNSQASSEMLKTKTQEKVDTEAQYQQWAMDAALQWEADRYNQMSSFEKAMYELKRAYRNFDVANYQTYSNFMMNSLNKKNKAEFAVYKGFAIVQATMDTHKAAVAAYAAMAGIPFVGPVLAAAAAATAVALGMRNVANIAKMQPPKAASGGYIPGSPGGTHLIAGEGGRGEAILPLENSEAMDKIRGAFSGVTINLSGNIFARDDWPREIVMKIDRELYKLKQDRRSALFS